MTDQTRQRPPREAGTVQSVSVRHRPPDRTRLDELDAARNLADRAKRLSLRAAGMGHVDHDDVVDVIAATGHLLDVLMGGVGR